MRMMLINCLHIWIRVCDDIKHTWSIRLLFEFKLSLSTASFVRVFASTFFRDRWATRLAATKGCRSLSLLSWGVVTASEASTLSNCRIWTMRATTIPIKRTSTSSYTFTSYHTASVALMSTLSCQILITSMTRLSLPFLFAATTVAWNA